MAEFQLDTLVTTFTGDSSEYEAVLEQVRASNEGFLKDLSSLRKSMQEAFTGDSDIGQVFEQSFSVARESTGQFTREYTTAMGAASQSTEAIFQDIEQLSQRMRDNHAAVREGETSREQYRQNLEAQRQELQSLVNDYNRAARGVTQYGGATTKAVSDTDDLDETIKALSNSVRTSRNEWAARIQSDEQFRESTEALHREMWELYEAGELTGDQMRKLTQDMAYAQRGLDSVNKVASRGGLAWTAQIGIADAFGSSLRNMGPAGNVAAGGLRTAQMGFAALVTPISLADLNLKKLAISLGSVAKMLPLIAAAGATAAAAGLWRMASASAEMATQMEVASQRTGLNVEALQEYQYAAKQAGIEGERFNTVAQRILRRAADAQAGNEGLAKAFDQLGVSLTDADGNLRGIEDLLGQVADGLFEVENQGERVALAFKIMDTEGSQMLNFLSAGSEGIEEMRQQARDLGLVISGDTIMSLSEFGNQVNELSRQFEVAKTEIVAAFLPVLRDGVLPLIQQGVIPALQTVATRLGEFADAFTDVSDEGVRFRADFINNITLLLQMKDLVVGVTQGFIAFSRFVGGAAAYAGTMIGDLSVQVQGLGGRFAKLFEGLEWWERGASWWTLGGLMRELEESEEALIDFAGAHDRAAASASSYYASANESSQAAASAFARMFNPSQYAEDFEAFWQGLDLAGPAEQAGREAADGVSDGITDGMTTGAAAAVRTIADVISDMLNAIGVAGQRAAHNVAVGMDESTAEAIRLGEELTVVTQAYNTLLTGDFDASDTLLIELRQQVEDLQAALDNLPGAATATAWAGRLQLELELGVKEPQEVIDILTPRLQELIAERDELLAGGAYNTAAFTALTTDIKALQGAVDAATNELPEVAESAARRIVRAFTNAAREVLDIDFQISVPREVTAVAAFGADNLEFEEAARLARLLGQEFDPLNTQIQINERRIKQLNGEYASLTVVERMWLDNLSRETAALREQQAAVGGASRALTGLVNSVNGVRVAVPDALQEAGQAVTGFLDVTMSVARDARIAEALGAEFNAVESEVQHLTNAVTQLAADYGQLSAAERVLLTLLSRRLELLNAQVDAQDAAAVAAEEATNAAVAAAAEQQAAVESTTVAYEGLMAALEGIGRTVDPIDAQRQALRDLAATGLLTTEQVIAAINAEGAARERLAAQIAEQEAATEFAGVVEGVRGARNALMEFVGKAPGQFDDFRDALDKLSEDDWPALAAAIGITTEQLEWFLENSKTLIAALERTEAFNTLAGQVGGLGGALLRVAADMNTAIATFAVTEERLPLVAASFNAATAAAEAFKDAFADGFDAEEVLSGIIGIGSGLAATLGSPALGEAFAAIGGFVQSILGDLSNGLKQIREQVDGIASSSRYASRELVQAFADMNTSRESRGGLFGWALPKKTVIDEVEVKRLTGIAENVASGLASAFGAVDLTAFREAFNLGIDEVIQEQIIAGFMDSPEVQNALEAITLALDSDDYAKAREGYDKLRDSAEAIYEQTQRWNREMRKVKGYADEIEAATRATQDLLASTATSQLERAFATGAMGLQEYAAALAALSDSDVTRDFTRQMDDLKAVRDEALAEGADPAYIRALDEQIRALQGSWQEALEQGAYEAAETIKQILGTSIGDVQALFRSAFDSSTFDDFLSSFGTSLLMTTRNALITAFLESAVIKPLMDELSNAITDAVIDGMITEAELEGILKIGDAITGEMEWFFDLLEELGLGFDALTDGVNAATAAMSNVPTVWKGTLAEWNATTPTTQGGYSTASASGMLAGAGSSMTEVHVHGDVYGVHDLDDRIQTSVAVAQRDQNYARSGR